MKKAAILFSGYFRYYDRLYKNFIEHVITPLSKGGYQPDIFFSTWDRLNSDNSASAHEGSDGKPSYGVFNLQDIINKYNPKGYIVGNFEDNKEKFNILKYDPLLDLSQLYKNHHDGHGILFSLAQYYHRQKVNELKRKAELSNGLQYDLVISMRPDLFFLEPLNLNNIDINKLNLRTLYNDAFFISSSSMDDKVSSVFNCIQEIVNKYGQKKFGWLTHPYVPEHFLEYHLIDEGIALDNRKELGEQVFWYYPRHMFLEFVAAISEKTNRADIFSYTLNYFSK